VISLLSLGFAVDGPGLSVGFPDVTTVTGFSVGFPDVITVTGFSVGFVAGFVGSAAYKTAQNKTIKATLFHIFIQFFVFC